MSDRSEVIVGIDVVASSSKLSNYLYALAVLKDGELTLHEDVSLSRLIRFLWELKPKLIALDNIMELGGSKRNLVKILKLLPPESKIVQVTLNNNELVDLRKLAIKAGIQLEQGKLSPQKTAEVLAVLCSKGFGTVLKLFEDKVKVIVGRGRVPGSGGSSSERFKRSLRASVLSTAKRLKEELERRGLDYDLTFRKSEGGIDSALFIIYAPRHELSGIIKSMRGYDVTIKVKPVIRKKLISTIFNVSIDRYLIIGVDPGIETGLAIVDLELKPLIVTSSKNLDREEIIQTVLKYGTPVLVATDKNPPPEMVEKIAANLNALLYYPSKSLSSIEKETLIYDYVSIHGLNLKTTHERDSLASCIKAYKEFEDKFRQLVIKLNEIGLPISKLQKFKAEIIRGKSIAEVIEEVISSYISKESTYGRDNLVRVIRMLANEEISKKDKELLNQLEKISKERDMLRGRIKELERRLSELETELTLRSMEFDVEVAKDREVSELKHRLRKLSDYVKKLEEQMLNASKLLDLYRSVLQSIYSGRYVLVKYIRRLSPDELTKEIQGLGTLREGEVIFVREFHESVEEAFNILKDLRVKIVVPKFVEIPPHILDRFESAVKQCDDFIEVSDNLVALPSSVILELSRIEKEMQEKSKRKLEVDHEKLLNILMEYRSERTANVDKS
ncbi:MAG: DUF460 domain-containing protein [Sulfolobales archaeon]|nr:DUF460 domain-containing protein [Sulfolobales archaeon]MCX8185593.1 DUF460 domain-containing protein [Sulfolobales archaeon]MDW7969536.1 DUF460 domain-containing protein [Sulfolobales archaeon]